MRWLLALVLGTGMLHAEGEAAGDFDYFVLSLSWSPNWCALEGDARDASQCTAEPGHGWVLHGLWPQFERGWPSYCRTRQTDPGRAETAAMADLFGSGGAAWYQWKKHGRCAGLPAADYFGAARRAYDALTRPQAFRALTDTVQISTQVVEQAFLKANPQLGPDMITITCKGNWIQEARICLTRSLEPRNCGDDVVRDCTLPDALFKPIR